MTSEKSDAEKYRLLQAEQILSDKEVLRPGPDDQDTWVPAYQRTPNGELRPTLNYVPGAIYRTRPGSPTAIAEATRKPVKPSEAVSEAFFARQIAKVQRLN